MYNMFSVKTLPAWTSEKLTWSVLIYSLIDWLIDWLITIYSTQLQMHRTSFHTISNTHCSWFSDSFWSFSVQLAAAVQRVLLLCHCLFGVDSIDFVCDNWISSLRGYLVLLAGRCHLTGKVENLVFRTEQLANSESEPYNLVVCW